MKAWSQFFRDVLPDVMGCPEPSMELALLRAAREFFAGAHVWTVWLDNTMKIAGITEYDIELERNCELVKVLRATLGDRRIDITTPDSLPDDWQINPTARAECIFTSDGKTITLLPSNATGLLRVQAVLKPSNAAVGIEDYLFDRYVEPIATGAKARLMLQPGKPYSNPAYGSVLDGQFRDAISGILIQRFRAFSKAFPRARIQTY